MYQGIVSHIYCNSLSRCYLFSLHSLLTQKSFLLFLLLSVTWENPACCESPLCRFTTPSPMSTALSKPWGQLLPPRANEWRLDCFLSLCHLWLNRPTAANQRWRENLKWTWNRGGSFCCCVSYWSKRCLNKVPRSSLLIFYLILCFSLAWSGALCISCLLLSGCFSVFTTLLRQIIRNTLSNTAYRAPTVPCSSSVQK